MRRVVVDTLLSLDGYFAGPDNEIDWFIFDEESRKWSSEILRRVGGLIFGRVTYEGFAEYWSTPAASDETAPTASNEIRDAFIARRLNELEKFVFSTTLKKANWTPATLLGAPTVEAITRLKAQPGKDLLVVGSGSVVGWLARENLIDEFRIRIVPIVLGAGKPLFRDPRARHPLRLVSARAFPSGVVALHYEPAVPTESAPARF